MRHGKCMEHFGEIHPEGKSPALVTRLICMIARNEETTKMSHYALAAVFAPNIVPVSSDENDGEIDPLKAQMAFNVAVRGRCSSVGVRVNTTFFMYLPENQCSNAHDFDENSNIKQVRSLEQLSTWRERTLWSARVFLRRKSWKVRSIEMSLVSILRVARGSM